MIVNDGIFSASNQTGKHKDKSGNNKKVVYLLSPVKSENRCQNKFIT